VCQLVKPLLVARAAGTCSPPAKANETHCGSLGPKLLSLLQKNWLRYSREAQSTVIQQRAGGSLQAEFERL
jgi:hypothetical protein